MVLIVICCNGGKKLLFVLVTYRKSILCIRQCGEYWFL